MIILWGFWWWWFWCRLLSSLNCSILLSLAHTSVCLSPFSVFIFSLPLSICLCLTDRRWETIGDVLGWLLSRWWSYCLMSSMKSLQPKPTRRWGRAFFHLLNPQQCCPWRISGKSIRETGLAPQTPLRPTPLIREGIWCVYMFGTHCAGKVHLAPVPAGRYFSNIFRPDTGPPRYACFYSGKRQLHWYRPLLFPHSWPFLKKGRDWYWYTFPFSLIVRAILSLWPGALVEVTLWRSHLQKNSQSSSMPSKESTDANVYEKEGGRGKEGERQGRVRWRHPFVRRGGGS